MFIVDNYLRANTFSLIDVIHSIISKMMIQAMGFLKYQINNYVYCLASSCTTLHNLCF